MPARLVWPRRARYEPAGGRRRGTAIRVFTRFAEAFTDFCLGRRKTVLAILLALTALAASQVPRGHFENAMEVWFLRGDPALADHHELIETFGSDEFIVVGIEAPDVFTPDVLALVDRLTREIEAAPHVEKVFSLTSIEAITGDGDTLHIDDLVTFPLDATTLPALRRKALANELYVGNVVSKAGDFTAIVARLPHVIGDFDYKVEAVTAIEAILDRAGAPGLLLAGGPVVDDRFYEMTLRDSSLTSGLMLVLLGATLWVLLRSLTAMLVPLVTVVVATVWALGWIVLAGSQYTAVTSMLPSMLLAMGVAYSMHVVVEYRRRFVTGAEDKMRVLREVCVELALPLTLCNVTTAIGLGSLAVSRVQGVREFGVYAAVGVMGAFVLSVTLVPIALSLLPAPPPHVGRRRTGTDRWLLALHEMTMRHPRPIVALFSLAIVLATAGMLRVRAESDFMSLFPSDEPVNVATRRFEEKLSGTVSLEVMIDTGRPEGIKDPAVLRDIDALQAFVVADPAVSAAQSITGYMKDLRRAFFGNDQREYRLPASHDEAAQYLLLYEMDEPDGDLKDYVTFDYSKARLSARVDLKTSNDAIVLVDAVEDYVARTFPPEIDVTVTGLLQLYAHMEEYIRSSMIQGFGSALAVIYVVFWLQLRSVGLAAIAMIPNVFPILMALGVMGFAGIRLDSMTTMVASISIGLAVDDTIHFLDRVGVHTARGLPMREALREATIEVGRAVTFTLVALCAGFGVMLFSTFVGAVYFGLLSLLAIVFGRAADLLLLPVLLRWYGARGVRLPLDGTKPAGADVEGRAEVKVEAA